MPQMVVGAIVNSAIYLVAVFYAGLTYGHPYAWKFAIAAMGVTYLSYLVQIPGREAAPTIAAILVVASILLGAAAGIALLF